MKLLSQYTTDTKDFRLYLQSELIRRCKKNPGYSLRAFARSLQISPSSLSRILRGERAISELSKAKLGNGLGLHPIELKRFKTTPSKKNSFNANITSELHELTLDVFSVIADWYHYAILEVVKTRHFKPQPRWIAKTLGITVSEANAAVERLVRLKLLKISASGKWVNVSNNTNITSDVSSAAHRFFQKQVLNMALTALNEIPLERRNQTSMTMAINLKRLPEAIAKIADFRRQMNQFFEQDSKKDEVYQFSISLYPVTRIEAKRRTK